MIKKRANIVHWVVFSVILSATVIQGSIVNGYGNYVAYVFNNCAHSLIFIGQSYIIYLLADKLGYNNLKKSAYVMIIICTLVFGGNALGVSYAFAFYCGILVLFLFYAYKTKLT